MYSTPIQSERTILSCTLVTYCRPSVGRLEVVKISCPFRVNVIYCLDGAAGSSEVRSTQLSVCMYMYYRGQNEIRLLSHTRSPVFFLIQRLRLDIIQDQQQNCQKVDTYRSFISLTDFFVTPFA